MYQSAQLPGLPVPIGDGVVVTTGGIGTAVPKSATQYQYPDHRPLQFPARAGFHCMNWACEM
jgi:hypothetical protein